MYLSKIYKFNQKNLHLPDLHQEFSYIFTTLFINLPGNARKFYSLMSLLNFLHVWSVVCYMTYEEAKQEINSEKSAIRCILGY